MAVKKNGILGFLRLRIKKATKSTTESKPEPTEEPEVKHENDGTVKQDDEPVVFQKPRRKIPNGQIPPNRPYALHKLPSELLLYIAEEFLDEISIICLKLTSKELYAVIPKDENSLNSSDKLQLLAKFPPRTVTLHDHPHSYLCKECVKWHSLSSTAIWPAWKPEDTFASFEEFAAEEPRTCIRTAVSSGRWTLRWFIEGNKNFLLCEKCNGLYSTSYKRCSWHCEDCGKCTGRQGWSALCSACTALRGGIERPMKYQGQLSVLNAPRQTVSSKRRLDVVRSRTAPAGSNLNTASSNRPDYPASRAVTEVKERKKCPRCLGWKQWDLHSPDVCRCFEAADNDKIGHDGLIYTYR